MAEELSAVGSFMGFARTRLAVMKSTSEMPHAAAALLICILSMFLSSSCSCDMSSPSQAQLRRYLSSRVFAFRYGPHNHKCADRGAHGSAIHKLTQ